MQYEPIFPRPNRVIELYPYTEPGTDITGPLLGYRIVGFENDYPEFTVGRHDYAEDVIEFEGSSPTVYRGSYVVKPITSLYDYDPKVEFYNTIRNYRTIAVVSPLTKVNVARYMMDSNYWVYPSPMDYVRAGGTYKVPVYDHLDTRVQLLDVLEELGFVRSTITFLSTQGQHLYFDINVGSTISENQKTGLVNP